MTSSTPLYIPGRKPFDPDRTWHRSQQPVEIDFTMAAAGVPGVPDAISSIHVSLPASTKFNLTINTVKAAVRRLRFDHPAIALELGWSAPEPAPDHAQFVYEAPASEEEVAEWLSRAVVEDKEILGACQGDLGEATDSLIREAGKGAIFSKPVFKVTLVSSPPSAGVQSYGLVFEPSHSVFDGIGTFQMINLCVEHITFYLAAVDDDAQFPPIPWGDEVSRLPVAVFDDIPTPLEYVEADVATVTRKVDEVTASYKTSLGLPAAQVDTNIPTGSGIIFKSLPKETLSALIQAARNHGTTIFGIQWAAMVIALVQANPPSSPGEINVPSLIGPVSIRALAETVPEDRTQWKARMSTVFIPCIARRLDRFVSQAGSEDTEEVVEAIWILAREAREEVLDQRTYLPRVKNWIASHGAAAIQSVLSTIKPGTSEIPCNGLPFLSSIGVIDPYLSPSHPIGTSRENVTISRPRMIVRAYKPFLGYCYAIHSFTWQGEFYFAFSFVEEVLGRLSELVEENGSVLKFYNQFWDLLALVAKAKNPSSVQ